MLELKGISTYIPSAAESVLSKYLDDWISEVSAELGGYNFFIAFLDEIKTHNNIDGIRNKKISIMYALLQGKYKIETINLAELKRLSALSANNEFHEFSFFKEMIDLLSSSGSILPAYKNFHKYLSYSVGSKVGVNSFDEQEAHFFENIRIINNRLEIFKKYADIKKNNVSVSVFNQACVQRQEMNSFINQQTDISLKLKTFFSNPHLRFNFDDLADSVPFISNTPELMHQTASFYIKANIKSREIIAFFDVNNKEIEEAAKERDEVKKRHILEKHDAFRKDRARLKDEAAQRAEQRRVEAETEKERQRLAKIEIESSSPPLQTAVKAEAAGAADTNVSARIGQKIKTRGIAASDALNDNVEVEVSIPAARVIGDDIQSFVNKIIDADFETVKILFETELAAVVELESNNKYIFSFRSPVSNEFTKFYADNPHGAQLEKFKTAWRVQMIKALERAEIKLR